MKNRNINLRYGKSGSQKLTAPPSYVEAGVENPKKQEDLKPTGVKCSVCGLSTSGQLIRDGKNGYKHAQACKSKQKEERQAIEVVP